jgi:ketosteroid isomerase-like protein
VSRNHLELVRRAFSQGDLEATAANFWHPEIEYVEDPKLPGASSYRGRDEVLRCWQGYLEVLGAESDIAIEVEDVIDAGERIVALVRFRGETPGGEMPFDHAWGYVVGIRDGRIAFVRAYYEPSEALAAAGLAD